MRVAGGQSLAVSLYLPDPTPSATFHWDGRQTAYVGRGNQVAAESIQVQATTDVRLFLTGILVDAEPGARAVVAFGDSITDGNAATVDADQRWPDHLSRLLAGRSVAVLNAGISGARLLSNRMGDNALARFQRDVLSQPGVDTVVVLLGINDIGWPGTLLPFRDALPGTPMDGYYTRQKEQLRTTVNRWIRSSGAFDAVVDFDAALRDPEQPERLRSVYDSGDHLHPNDEGYAAMAKALNPVLLRSE